MTEGLADRRHIVIRNTTRWFVAVMYSLIAAGGAASLFVSRHGAPMNILLIIAIAGFATLAVRGLRSSITADRDGVTARADRFTRRLAWTDIDRFETRTSAVSSALGAWKIDGSWVRLMDRGYDSRQRTRRH